MNSFTGESEGFCTTDLLLAFFGGAIVGAGAALLLAPQSGSQTRESIGSLAERAKGWVSKFKEGEGDEGGMQGDEDARESSYAE